MVVFIFFLVELSRTRLSSDENDEFTLFFHRFWLIISSPRANLLTSDRGILFINDFDLIAIPIFILV
jgi:hypothetical protein